jgi:hypothetical protein
LVQGPVSKVQRDKMASEPAVKKPRFPEKLAPGPAPAMAALLATDAALRQPSPGAMHSNRVAAVVCCTGACACGDKKGSEFESAAPAAERAPPASGSSVPLPLSLPRYPSPAAGPHQCALQLCFAARLRPPRLLAQHAPRGSARGGARQGGHSYAGARGGPACGALERAAPRRRGAGPRAAAGGGW